MPRLFSDTCRVKLDGKLAVITGANTGIGKCTAKDLSSRGARVLMLCRDVDKANAAASEIRAATGGSVEVMKLDLASLKSVRECSEAIKEKEEMIDLLINNAGVMVCPQWKTEDGFDMQFGTNHLGHFLLTELLLPLVKNSAEKGNKPRIVIVSSLAHETGSIHWDDLNFEKANSYGPIKAYCQSKLANVLHSNELARRLEGTGITVNSLHPGSINTDLQRHLVTSWYGKLLMPLAKPFLKTPLQGTQTTLYCALSENLEGVSGKYFSDCREKRPQRLARDEEAQKKLWEISEKLVGLKPL